MQPQNGCHKRAAPGGGDGYKMSTAANCQTYSEYSFCFNKFYYYYYKDITLQGKKGKGEENDITFT